MPAPRLAAAVQALRLVRPANVALAAAGTVVGAALARGWPEADGSWAAAAGATAALTAFGNVLNDLRDEALDREAHPDRPLPQGFPRPHAWLLACALLGIGLGLAGATGRPAAFALAGANVVLLVAYELALKRLGLPGNLAVAYLVGSTLAFGSLAAGGGLPAGVLLAALLALLANLARELLKDLEDAPADAGHRATFPLERGADATRWAALTAVAAAVVLSGALAGLAGRYPGVGAPEAAGLALLAAADAALLAAAGLAWRSAAAAPRGLMAGLARALPPFARRPRGAAFP